MNQASELWKELVKRGGIQVRTYDAPLVDELAEYLNIPRERFGQQLRWHKVDAQSLLEGLLRLVSPFAQMTSDILAFFAEVQAHESNDNLRVDFDFGKGADSFSFDLSNFRDWDRRLHESIRQVRLLQFTRMRALELRHAFILDGVTTKIDATGVTQVPPPDPDAGKWWRESSDDSSRLSPLPRSPDTEDADLSRALAEVWAVLRVAVSSLASDGDSPNFTSEDIRLIVQGAYHLVQTERPYALTARIDPVFENLDGELVDENTLYEQLVEVFNLPVWNRRSELYAIWVGVRALMALGSTVRVHVVDGALRFSFAGTHLATARLGSGEHLHVWSELRTPARGLIGRGRKRAVQPDYVFLGEPTSDPSAARMVVECKQYLRSNRRNFSDALIDYANGHPSADVLLVNYGPIKPSVLAAVEEKAPKIKDRTRVIERLRPGYQDQIALFEAEVARLVSSVQTDESSPSEPVEIDPDLNSMSLTWTTDADLDLHCWLIPPVGEAVHVGYDNLDGAVGSAKAQLERDIQTGGSSETIRWTAAPGVALEFAVHAFTEGTAVANQKPRVDISTGGLQFRLSPNDQQHGRWWRIMRVDPDDGGLRFWNHVLGAPPIDLV